MDWPTFVTELIKALAWPITVLIIIIVLRKPLANLLPTLQRLRYRDLEIEFGRQVQELSEDVKRELPAATAAGTDRPHVARLGELAQLSPRAVVLESWLDVEEAAIEATRRRGLNLAYRELRAPILLGQALEQSGILDESKAQIYHRLRILRNAAAHASEFAFEPDSALEYADAAMRLAAYLRAV
jgi:hypothetical protein